MKNGKKPKLYLLKTAEYALGFVSFVLLIGIILLLIVFLVQFIANEGKYPILMVVVEPVRAYFYPLVELIHKTVPYQFGKVDLSVFISCYSGFVFAIDGA